MLRVTTHDTSGKLRVDKTWAVVKRLCGRRKLGGGRFSAVQIDRESTMALGGQRGSWEEDWR